MAERATTVVYNDPILTADDINLAAYEESMQRFYEVASEPHTIRTNVYYRADLILDNRYNVVTDEMMQSIRSIYNDTHPVDRNASQKWPFPNPFGRKDPRS